MNLKELSRPFEESQIKYRVGRSGMKQGSGDIWAMLLSYIDARHVYDRLDEVCGPENWEVRHTDHVVSVEGKGDIKGIISSIGIKINDHWIFKEGGADSTDYESFKGCISDADKRAAVLWGIGRHLYDRKEMFAEVSMTKVKGWNFAKHKPRGKKDGIRFWWRVPGKPIEQEIDPNNEPEPEDNPFEDAGEMNRVEMKPMPDRGSAIPETPTPQPVTPQPVRQESPQSTQDGRSLPELKDELENKLITVFGSGEEMQRMLPVVTANPLSDLSGATRWDFFPIIKLFNQKFHTGGGKMFGLSDELTDTERRNITRATLLRHMGPEEIPSFLQEATRANGIKEIRFIKSMKQFGLMKRRIDDWIKNNATEYADPVSKQDGEPY